jgi:PAS domain S-box-containing protein
MAPESDRPAEGQARFRWQTFFQQAAEPIFLLSRRRRVLFVNRAWETWTGLSLSDVRGRPCRRGTATAAAREDQILAALAPPPEALAGEPCRVRRRLVGASGTAWCEISYFALNGPDGVLGVLGRCRIAPATDAAAFALPERLMTLRDRQAARYRLDDLGAESPLITRLQEQARLAVQMTGPVLLTGEPGTGKAWLARALHLAGPARDKYFARLDCARLPPVAVSDLLFGPRRARLSLGTIYLREPGRLPREDQARLAQLLMEPAPLPRLIVGVRGEPQQALQSGQLLEELYCRVSTLTLALPPLRERRDELQRLVDRFLRRAAEAAERPVHTVSAEAFEVLRLHSWPGNLRELYAVLRDACRHARGEQLELADLPFHLRHGPQPQERRLPLDELLAQAERRLIELALRLGRGNKTKAADLLAIWRPRLLRRMEHFGLLDPNAAPEADDGPGPPAPATD